MTFLVALSNKITFGGWNCAIIYALDLYPNNIIQNHAKIILFSVTLATLSHDCKL